MFRTIYLATPPATALFAAVAVKQNGEDKPAPAPQQKNELAHYQCKPSELPLYTPLHAQNKPKPEHRATRKSGLRDSLEGGICVVRTEVQTAYNAAREQMKVLDDYYETGKAHTQAGIDYLNQPQNVLPRSGAIAIGGLSGFIFAARGGFIKKVLYTTIGAGAIASLCYPKQAEHLAQDVLHEARKGYVIAYNFVKGVKPGDEVPTEPINKFPTSVADLKNLALDWFDEAKEAIFPKKK